MRKETGRAEKAERTISGSNDRMIQPGKRISCKSISHALHNRHGVSRAGNRSSDWFRGKSGRNVQDSRRTSGSAGVGRLT